MILRRRLPATAAIAATGLLALGAGMTGAAAATTQDGPAGGSAPAGGPASPNFIPPEVEPISVNIGHTVLGGKVINPGLHVTTPGYDPANPPALSDSSKWPGDGSMPTFDQDQTQWSDLWQGDKSGSVPGFDPDHPEAWADTWQQDQSGSTPTVDPKASTPAAGAVQSTSPAKGAPQHQTPVPSTKEP